ncbi:type 1 glutamine amidotransferase [Tomitella biformata]|uniref:type 1 glutamine amidotransferase n=1 Tax=Tomitella biformata TaxID=630403 RepID=UPI0004634A22|nr:glutamine amidotransferase [Tomitella biformata]
MTSSTVRIGLILPDVLGTYGDGGNALVLRQRLRMRGHDAEIIETGFGEPVPDSLDIYTLGGGEDTAQMLAARHMTRHPGLQSAVRRGAPTLAVCAGLQVLGEWFETSDGRRVEGLGLLDATTTPAGARSIGEVVAEPRIAGLTGKLTGFENHGGATTLGPDAAPLGRVLSGAGNRPAETAGERFEGGAQGSLIATYLHGPVLARNPELADLLIARALGVELSALAPLQLAEVDLLRSERLAAR